MIPLSFFLLRRLLNSSAGGSSSLRRALWPPFYFSCPLLYANP
jgi:hypothetical protein